MPRVHPAVERLERENALLRRELDRMRADPGDLPVSGCGDNSCEVRTPSGMATNGGCNCDVREVRRALRYYRRLALFRQETIRELVAEVARLRGEAVRLEMGRESAEEKQ